MAHQIVRLITDDDDAPTNDKTWHFADHLGDCSALLCNGHVFGSGVSSAEFEIKTISSGGITCKSCLSRIKLIRSIKL